MVSRTRRTDGDRPRGAGGEVRGKKQKKKQNVSKKTSRLTDEFVVVDSGLGLAADVPRVDHVSGVVVVVVLALQRQFLQRRSHFGAVDAAARRTTVRKIGKELEKKKKNDERVDNAARELGEIAKRRVRSRARLYVGWGTRRALSLLPGQITGYVITDVRRL